MTSRTSTTSCWTTSRISSTSSMQPFRSPNSKPVGWGAVLFETERSSCVATALHDRSINVDEHVSIVTLDARVPLDDSDRAGDVGGRRLCVRLHRAAQPPPYARARRPSLARADSHSLRGRQVAGSDPLWRRLAHYAAHHAGRASRPRPARIHGRGRRPLPPPH